MSELNYRHPKVQDLIATSMEQGEHVAYTRTFKWLKERICATYRDTNNCEHAVCANNNALIKYLNRGQNV